MTLNNQGNQHLRRKSCQEKVVQKLYKRRVEINLGQRLKSAKMRPGTLQKTVHRLLIANYNI